MEKSPRAHRSPSDAGFTLVELIAVLTIAAILAAMAGPRLPASQPFAEGGYADEIAAALRQARAVAVASGCDVQFSIDANGYSALQHAAAGTHCATSGAWTTPVRRGDGSDLAGWPPNSANVATARTLVFGIDGALTSSPVSIVIGAGAGAHTVSVGAGGWVQRQ